MKHLYRLLNLFPNKVAGVGVNSRTTNVVVGLILLVCLGLMGTMMYDIEPKLAFMVDGIHLPSDQRLTVGEGSALCYEGVPKDYLTLQHEDGGFTWRIDSLHNQDSLMYLKINNENPQKHTVENSAQQIITLRIDGETFAVTGQQVWQDWESFAEQKDVMLRHFAVRHNLVTAADESATTLRHWLNEDRLRSFFEKSDKGIVLVILDRYTTIGQEGGRPVGYRFSGRVTQSDQCKVQFFRVSNYCYFEDEADDGKTFRIDSVNYVMKASVMLTGWGAGHVMLDCRGEGTELRFPKPLGYVGTVDSLMNSSLASSHHITFKQQGLTFPSRNDIYLPQVSTAIPHDFCSVEIKDTYDIQIRDNNNEVTDVQQMDEEQLGVLPILSPLDLHSGAAVLHCRVGIIDGAFALSYCLLPLLVVLVLLLLVLGPWSPVRIAESVTLGEDDYACPAQLTRYPAYLAMLLAVAFCYACCKSLIALKLSYTYPYFEKLTGISPVSTAMFLLLFFTMAMVINTHLLSTHERKDEESFLFDSEETHPWRKWGAWILTTGLFVGLIFVFFRELDSQVSGGVLSAYYRNEVFSPYFWKWPDIHGINDLHRSVPYAQMLIEACLLLVWLLQNLCWQWRGLREVVDNCWRWCKEKWSRFDQAMNQGVSQLYEKVLGMQVSKLDDCAPLQRVLDWASTNCVFGFLLVVVLLVLALLLPVLKWPLAILAMVILLPCVWEPFKLTIRSLWPGHFILLLLLAVGGQFMGNFGTAFITLGVILGLCSALTNITFAKTRRREELDNRHSVFFQMILTSMIYIVCAMVADHGYLTNYVGFLMAVIGFYYIYDRNTDDIFSDPENNEKESRWTNWISIFAVVFALSLPYICSHIFDPNEVNYDRTSRRVNMFADFGSQQSSGYRYAESDAEFMAIMSHYMQMENQQHDCDDPLCNEGHFLHPSISTGQSPVVLNDLSVPVAFVGAYGVGRTTAIFFLLLLALLVLVVQFSFAYLSGNPCDDDYLSYAMQWRLMALLMWLGTSFYIYMSYLGYMPFAGRLLPGFGVDAVGETLESALLLACMAAVTLRLKDKTDPTPD